MPTGNTLFGNTDLTTVTLETEVTLLNKLEDYKRWFNFVKVKPRGEWTEFLAHSSGFPAPTKFTFFLELSFLTNNRDLE